VSEAPALTREERTAELWRRGRLRWKLYEDQREVYDAIRAFLDDPETRFEQFWVDISRQYGKTFTGLLISTECAIRNAGWLIGYTAATRTALWQFVQPNMDLLLSDCPLDLRPHWDGQTSDYVFPNGSRIHLAGVNNGHENDARGPRRHLMVNEEAGFVDRYDYLVTSVEIPMLTTTGGRILNITTPAETPAHESHPYMLRCRERNHYVRRTIEDNRHLSEAAKAKIIAECGGRESTQARRELFCEWITDESRAIVPEYNETLDAELAATEPRSPTYETPTVAMDVGFEDWHHILFGYYDFSRAKRVVQAEVRLQRATTDKIARAIWETEARLWGYVSTPDESKLSPDALEALSAAKVVAAATADERMARGLPKLSPPVRWSDTDLRLIADLGELHQLAFLPTAKDGKEAQVNALRISLKAKGWHVSPSCVALRRQLRVGVWNKQRTEFDRSKDDGHYDAVDAALYFNRNVDVYRNPYPAVPQGVALATHHLAPGLAAPVGNGAVLQDIFSRRWAGGRKS
jgi:hypothetical protein